MANGLPWFRVDSDIAQNPKIVALISEHGQRGMAAAALFLFSIGYAAAHNTDGEMQKASLPFVHGTTAHARLLVEAGLWDAAESGWWISKYDEHQPTKATREAVSKERSEAARKAANTRWGNA